MITVDIGSYLNISKEEFKKNGIEFNETMAMYALKKYFDIKAIKEYYSDIDIVKGAGALTPLLAFRDKNNEIRKMFYLDVETNKLCFNQMRIPELRKFITEEAKENAGAISDIIKKSDNFLELSKKISEIDYKILNDRLSPYNSTMLMLAKLYSNYSQFGDVSEFDISIYDVLGKLLDNGFKEMTGRSHYTKAINKLSTERSTLSPEEMYENINIILEYENFNINSFSYENTSFEDRISKITAISKNHYQKNTLLSSILNSEKPIESIVDNLLFNKFKSSILFELKLLSKEKSLESIYEKNPVFDDIIKIVSKLDPKLNMPLSERLSHEKFVFDILDNKNDKKQNLLDIIDGVKIANINDISSFLSSKFIENNVTLIIPNYISEIKDKSFNLHYGTDSYSPYYLFVSHNAPFTMESDALWISQTFIKKDLPKYIIEDALEKIYIECLQTKKPVVFENLRLMNYVDEHIDTFLSVIEKYKDLVPTFILAIDRSKYKAIMDSDISYEQIILVNNLYEDAITNGSLSADALTKLKEKLFSFELENISKHKNKI